MPATMKQYNPFDKVANEQADAERMERADTISSIMNWVDGNHPDTLETAPGQRNDNVFINLCGQLKDDIIDYVGVPVLTVPSGTDNTIVAGALRRVISKEQQALDDFLDELDFDILFANALESGIVSGHVFIRIIVNDDGSVELGLIDPRYITVFWDITAFGRRDKLLFYRLSWQVGDDLYRQDIVPTELTTGSVGQWEIIEYKSKGGAKWNEVGRDIWPYEFPPIVDFQNKRRPFEYYGRSLLRNSPLMNDGINFIVSNTARIIKHHAHPKTFIVGGTLDDISESSIEGVWSFEDETVRVENLEMQSNLESNMNFYKLMRAAFFAEHRVVDSQAVKDKVGNLTNFGLRVMYSGHIKMIEALRSQYSGGFALAIQRAFIVAGQDIELPLARFEDPLPIDRRELIESVEKEKGLGITSDQTLALDLERDYMTELEQIAEERQAKLDTTTAGLERLGTLGLLS